MATSQSLSFKSQSPSSIKPLAIYWAIGIVVGFTFLRLEISQSSEIVSGSHLVAVAASLLVAFITTIAYKQITTDGGRPLHLPTLFGFSVMNGLCETVLFFASFKIGVAVASSFTTQASWLFWIGTITFFIYLGAIHALFWIKILPPHLNKSPEVKNIRRVWIVSLVVLSLLWGWMFFAHNDFWSVAMLHILFDAGMVYCIRYRLAW